MIDNRQPTRVSDVMAHEVVEVPMHETMAGSAEILRNSNVSGAPVVDERGHCIGVISNTDFAEQESLGRITAAAAASGLNYRVARCDVDGLYFIEEIASGEVDTQMSAPVRTVSSDASLAEAGQIMCQHHVHRLIVLDSAQRPLGVLSSLDLVRAAYDQTMEVSKR